jgi:hypothetical protein
MGRISAGWIGEDASFGGSPAMGALRDESSAWGREFFRQLRPWVSFVFLLALLGPFAGAIAYTKTLSHQDSMLFWIGEGYPTLALVAISVMWSFFASVFILTRFNRFRPLLRRGAMPHQAFDEGSRELLIVFSTILPLILALWCFLEWL